MKLPKLLPEHRVLMAQIKEEWLTRFYSAQQVDRELAKEGIDWLYTHSGKRKMPRVIFVDSPLMAQKAANYIERLLEALRKRGLKASARATSEVSSEVWSEVRSEVESEVWSEVRSEVESEVWSEVSSEVWSEVSSEVRSEVSSEVWSEVSSEVRSQVESEVRSQVESEVSSEVESEVRSEVRSEVSSEVWSEVLEKYYPFAWYAGGASDYGWVSFYDFFDKLGILDGRPEARDKFRIFRDKLLRANVYDMIQLNRFCIVVSLPKFVKRDNSRRVHSTTGHAIEFHDGYGINRIHGIRFDKDLFKKFTSGEVSALEIITHKNQDQKRAMAMAYGNERLVTELKAKVESEELDTKGNLMRILSIKDSEEDLVFYEAIDPAKNEKVYLRVPPAFKSKRPIEAKIWTFKELWARYEKDGKIPEFTQEE